jgi:hypothetical protein|tara:strand:+ start:782 stop:973 length:192 start_codon:yes stop_codon:yes gene_type:complete
VLVLLLDRRLVMVEQDTHLIYLESLLTMLVVVEEEEEVLELEQLVLVASVAVVLESMVKIWME